MEEKGSQPCFGSLKLDKEDEVPEQSTDDGVLFYVNKSGFPVDEFTWDRMWTHVAKLHPDGPGIARSIRHKSDLLEVPIPKAPDNFHSNLTIGEKLNAVQSYMNSLQYNHTGTQFFEIRKNRPITGLMESAREMIKEALPIKCLEAVILGVYLTNSLTTVDRFALSFKTGFNGGTFRHVVCGVYSFGKYGALGMSRRTDLMFKPMHFDSLSDMVVDYIAAYDKYFHQVKKVKVGMPIPHDTHSYMGIVWKELTVTPKKQGNNEEMCRLLDKHAREMRHQRVFLETDHRKIPPLIKEMQRKSNKKKCSPRSHSVTENKMAAVSSNKKKVSSGLALAADPTEVTSADKQPRKPVVNNNYQIRV